MFLYRMLSGYIYAASFRQIGNPEYAPGFFQIYTLFISFDQAKSGNTQLSHTLFVQRAGAWLICSAKKTALVFRQKEDKKNFSGPQELLLLAAPYSVSCSMKVLTMRYYCQVQAI